MEKYLVKYEYKMFEDSYFYNSSDIVDASSPEEAVEILERENKSFILRDIHKI